MANRDLSKGTILGRRYILTRPAKIDDFLVDNMIEDDSLWLEKARRLQVRRWRKIKSQEGA